MIEKAAKEFGWQKGQKAPPAAATASPLRATRTSPPIAPSPPKSRSSAQTGRPRLVRAVAAVDSGQVVNPDGLTNQIEGAILQSMSWTLYESVTFDDTRITSIDWQTYPILRFDAVPDSVDVHIINRPGQPFLGSGETGQGPAAASIANAIANATGQAAARPAADAQEDQGRDRGVRFCSPDERSDIRDFAHTGPGYRFAHPGYGKAPSAPYSHISGCTRPAMPQSTTRSAGLRSTISRNRSGRE